MYEIPFGEFLLYHAGELTSGQQGWIRGSCQVDLPNTTFENKYQHHDLVNVLRLMPNHLPTG